MVSTSKILTVSYGTFSCTLEGFDDSFDTMKAIAEYFRDLAADDRYFGAEPPTPDAELLARIAEKEIARRVDAHHEAGKIVLRADEPAVAEPAPVPVPEVAVQEQSAPVVQEAPQEPIEELSEPVEEPQAEDAEVDLSVIEAVAEAEPEIAEVAIVEDVDDIEIAEENIIPDVAAEEIETSVEDSPVSETSVEEEAPVEEDASAEEPETVMEAVLADVAPDIEMETPAEVAEPVLEDEAPAVEPIAEDMAAADMTFEDMAVEEVAEAPASHQETETSVSERLRRIRSVVAQGNADLVDDGYGEDEHAQDFLAETAADLDAALAQDDSMMEQDEPAPEMPEFEAESAEIAPEEPIESVAEEVLAEEEVAFEEDMAEMDMAPGTIESLSAQLENDEDIFAADDAEEEDIEDAGPASTEDTLAQLLADALPQGETVSEADLTIDAATDETLEEDDTLEADDDDFVEVEVEDDASFEDAGPEGKETPLRARVIKMKRSDFEAALADGSLEEAIDEEDEADVAQQASGLSPEEEADLQNELAAVEAELREIEAQSAATPEGEAEELVISEPEEADAPPHENMAQANDPFNENRRRSEQLLETNEVENLSHLFDEAETQREEPEANQRRNAIQHLRAAVAATKAEQKAGSDLRSETDENPYRSTLASVVRPRRSELLEDVIQRRSRPQRPMEARPAPLKLVAEQRVDTPRDPVRPRRVMTRPIDETGGGVSTEQGSFSAFAEEIGASSLPELLEAAAAYMSDVEGRDQFSRPMLMGKLKEVETEAFSREDGLRSFGHLLREGKLQKLKGGRFSVTEQTEFRGKARSVG